MSFSHRRAAALGLEWRQALKQLVALDLDPIRLSTYWDEVDQEGYSNLDVELEEATAGGRSVLLTLGMKAIGWPEFYIPSRLQVSGGLSGEITRSNPNLRAAVLDLVQRTAERYRDNPALLAWQVENEPLNRSGPHRWWIDPGFLEQEVTAVRQSDPEKPVVLTAFAHFNLVLDMLSNPWRQGAGRLLELLPPGGVLGLDSYIRVGQRLLGFDWVWKAAGDWAQDAGRWRRRAGASARDGWITEAQAEPWGERSFTPQDITTVYGGLRGAGYQTILLWGAEHWLARAASGDRSWLDAVAALPRA